MLTKHRHVKRVKPAAEDTVFQLQGHLCKRNRCSLAFPARLVANALQVCVQISLHLIFVYSISLLRNARSIGIIMLDVSRLIASRMVFRAGAGGRARAQRLAHDKREQRGSVSPATRLQRGCSLGVAYRAIPAGLPVLVLAKTNSELRSPASAAKPRHLGNDKNKL